MDSARFERCYRDPATKKLIGEFTKLAKESKVNATPTFFVGTRRIRGALPPALFRRVLLKAGGPGPP